MFSTSALICSSRCKSGIPVEASLFVRKSERNGRNVLRTARRFCSGMRDSNAVATSTMSE